MSPRICYEPKDFQRPTLEAIAAANLIIEEFVEQGYRLTLRQLYYQFVARDWLPNTERDYKRLQRIVNDGRLAGLIDWDAIEDRTRNLQSVAHWDDPADIIEASARSFRIDKWERQPWRIEVWIEKEALAGVFEGVCKELDLPFLGCRGYLSQSEMWAAAMRLRAHARDGQRTLILHFGDHDPSGIDMTRDTEDRMRVFGCDVRVRRIALNMDQVEEYEPPPNPAKVTDSRFDAYLQNYGGQSWELDALSPPILLGLVRDAVAEVRDDRLWEEEEGREREERRLLRRAADSWEALVDHLSDNGGRPE